MFGFVRNHQNVFHSGCIILHSHQQWRRFRIAPHILTSIWYCQCSRFWPFFFSLKTYGASFYILICYLNIFFGKVSVKVLGPLLIGLFVFLPFSFKNSVYILDSSPLLMCFSPSLWLVFSFSWHCLSQSKSF